MLVVICCISVLLDEGVVERACVVSPGVAAWVQRRWLSLRIRVAGRRPRCESFADTIIPLPIAIDSWQCWCEGCVCSIEGGGVDTCHTNIQCCDIPFRVSILGFRKIHPEEFPMQPFP